MEKAKIKIGSQSIRQNQIEIDINTAIGSINGPLREALENIGFTPSDELFRDCLVGGQKITDQYYNRLADELKAISIPSSRELFQKAAQEGLKQFHTVRQQVVNRCGSDVRKYISFQDEEAVFTEESQKQLIEDCGIYLTDPEEIELYNLHVKACEALNAMFDGHISPVWNQLFTWDKSKQFKPEPMTQYYALLSNIKNAKANGSK